MKQMIFHVDNIDLIYATTAYRKIIIERAPAEGDGSPGTFTLLDDAILLINGTTEYVYNDTYGDDTHWYRYNYVPIEYNNNSISGAVLYPSEEGTSGWSGLLYPGETDYYYEPVYSPEVSYTLEEKLIIKKIRSLIGDSVGVAREFGDEALSSIQPDGKTYVMDEKGWPLKADGMGASIKSVVGYRFVIFDKDIRDLDIDIWYNTFRFSDKEIADAYSVCTPPEGLDSKTTYPDAYMLKTAIELLLSETFEDAIEDGAVVTDDESKYDPSPGLKVRGDLIDKLQAKLDKLVRRYKMSRISGVLID